jgi:hypothetical protein
VQLAWLLGELLHQFADRCDYHDAFIAFLLKASQSPGVAVSGKSFHAFAGDTMEKARALRGDDSAILLATAAQSPQLPPHFRLLHAIALVAATGDAADYSGATERACTVMHEVLLDTCGKPCEHAEALSDLLVDTCTFPLSASSNLSRPLQLLKYFHRHLLNSHCTGVSSQRLQLAPLGRPVVFGKTPDREMFVCRLQLPTEATRATQTQATASGWWLKVERCSATTGCSDTTYSIFLNNGNASIAVPLQAAFEIGVVANTSQAMRKAEAAAVLIDHSGFMRPGLWTSNEAAIHRSAIRQEFSGMAWGIRHLFDDLSLARFGYDASSSPAVFVFGMVQLS